MVFKWRHITRNIFIFATGYLMLILNSTVIADADDWRAIERLAEQHPYIVALLNRSQDYVCTGTIFNSRTVVTTGNCIAYKPTKAMVGSAIYNKKINNNHTIFDIAYTHVHADYTFELKSTDPNVTRMHSNIGLVILNRAVIEIYISPAHIGNFYASELQHKKLKAVGFGKLKKSNMIVLQHQTYRQLPCANPKWYYCICGVEVFTHQRTYIYEFGRGAPVVYGTDVVGVTAIPCGTLTIRDLKYNIFTVIGPYLPWIEKLQANETTVIMRTFSNGSNFRQSLLYKCILMLLVISKVFD